MGLMNDLKPSRRFDLVWVKESGMSLKMNNIIKMLRIGKECATEEEEWEEDDEEKE